MRSQLLSVVAVLDSTGGQAVYASKEQAIKLTSLNAMQRITQGQKLYGSPEAESQSPRNE